MTVSWKNCFKIGLSIFVLYICIHYCDKAVGILEVIIGAAAPLLIGAAIAYLVNVLMSFYERHYFIKSKNKFIIKSRRPVCMAGAFLSLIAIVILVISFVVPQLISCVKLIIAELPKVMPVLVKRLEGFKIVPENITASLAAINWRSRIGDILKVLTSGMGSVMDILAGTVITVFSGIVTCVLSLIFSIYLLMSKDKLKGQGKRVMKHFLPDSMLTKTEYILSVLDDCFHNYIVGQCTEAVVLGTLCAVGMFILRLDYAAMTGALIAFTALIPIAGAYIGAGVGAFMLLTVSPVKSLIFLVFIVILQQLEGNLIYPKVVGSSIGLPGIWVLAAVTVGGGLMGVFGMLLGVPIAAALYRILKDSINGESIFATDIKPDIKQQKKGKNK